MAFNDLQMKEASKQAVLVAHKNLAKIQLFSHTFSELEGRPGESIAVPVYDLTEGADFAAGTNDYGTGNQEIGGVLINLDKHLVKSVSITDQELAYTGINWAKDTATALAERLTMDINKKIFNEINSTNVTQEESFSTDDKKTIASLYAIAEKYDIPVDKSIVVLNPENYAKVLALVDYSTIGTGDYIETGVINGLFGFKGFVCSSNLPDGTDGAIIFDEAIGVASKYLAPMTANAYPEAWSATDDNGFTIGFRRFMDLKSGKDNFACDCLFGIKLLQPTKIVRLVAGGDTSTKPAINLVMGVSSPRDGEISKADDALMVYGLNLKVDESIGDSVTFNWQGDEIPLSINGSNLGSISLATADEWYELTAGSEIILTFALRNGDASADPTIIKKTIKIVDSY